MVEELLERLVQKTSSATLAKAFGEITFVSTSLLRSRGPVARVGDLCTIETGLTSLLAEVVAQEGSGLILTPLGSVSQVTVGATISVIRSASTVSISRSFLGRAIDARGRSIDGKVLELVEPVEWPIDGVAVESALRPAIKQRLPTGVKVIDLFTTLGKGQRIGVFAGAGVGKSTLLSTIARAVDCDVKVVAMIGERSREVGDAVAEIMAGVNASKTVLIVATADQPAVERVRAAKFALAVCEYFRAEGLDVLLSLDSVTRLSMALREVGLASGEPPTVRGYTPSVFAELPRLCERCGTVPGGGSITAIFSVLVEGDDLNEPISDYMRSILDGHIVLSRERANEGMYPAVDILLSNSRVAHAVVPKELTALTLRCRTHLANFNRSRALIEMGAYAKGSSASIDLAIDFCEKLAPFLRQDPRDYFSMEDSVNDLSTLENASASNSVTRGLN